MAVAHDRAVFGPGAVPGTAAIDADVVGVRAADVVAEFMTEDDQVPVLVAVVLDRIGKRAVEVRAQAVAVVAAQAGQPGHAAAESAAAEEVGEITLHGLHFRLPPVAEGVELVGGSFGVPRVLVGPEPDVVRPEADAEVSFVDAGGCRHQRSDVAEGGVGVAGEEARQLLVAVDREGDELAAGTEAHRSVAGLGNTIRSLGSHGAGGADVRDGVQQVGSAEVRGEFRIERREGIEPVDQHRAVRDSVRHAEGDAIDPDPAFDAGGTEGEEGVAVRVAVHRTCQREEFRAGEDRLSSFSIHRHEDRVRREWIDRLEDEIDRACSGEREASDANLAVVIGHASSLVDQHGIHDHLVCGDGRSSGDQPEGAGHQVWGRHDRSRPGVRGISAGDVPGERLQTEDPAGDRHGGCKQGVHSR